MRSVNKIILIGNLTRDPEIRQTPNGQNVTTFGIATNREWITRDNKKQSITEFHDLVAWAKLAEMCHQHLKKGKLVYIEGYLKTRSWNTPENTKRFKTEIVVQDMIMLDKRSTNTEEDYIPEAQHMNHGMSSNVHEAENHESAPNPTDAKSTTKKTLEPKTYPPRPPEKTLPPTAKNEPAQKHEPVSKNISIDDDLGL